MPNILITQQGMDFVLSAHNSGVFIDLEYFVPCYDDRIDPTVRNPSVLSAYTQIADDSITTPIGEIIWNQTGYSLNTSSKCLISATTYAGGLMPNSYQSTLVQTNTKGSVPLSNQISATSWTTSGGSLIGLYNWSATGGAAVTGNNTRPNNTSADFWKCSDYYPVYDTSANENIRGSFKCVISDINGTIKFNKIALYAVAYQNGVPTTDVCFFGEAYLGTPAVVSNIGIGYDRFEYDIQIDISGTSASFEDIFYSSSADYWSHSPGGLYWPGKIGVGEFVDNQKSISATAHLRKARNDSGVVDLTMPILRMDYDNNIFTKIDQLGSSSKVISGTGGDIELGVNSWATYCGDAISVIPKIKQTLTLGNLTNRWREIWLSNTTVNSTTDPNKNASINIYNSLSAAIVVADAISMGWTLTDWQVIIGRPAGSGADLRAIRLNDLRMEIDPSTPETTATNLYGAYKGGDLWRESQNLLIYNTFCGESTSEYDVQNVYMMAGLDLNATYTSVDGQTGATHKNILYEIETASPGLFCGLNNNLASTAELHLAAKGKIGLHGPIEIQNLSEYADSEALANAILISRQTELNMLIGAGFTTAATFNNMADRMAALDTMQDLLATNSKLFLVAKNIYVDSSITPLNDGTQNLGSTILRFDNLYSKTIDIGRSSDDLNDLYTSLSVGGFDDKNNYIGGLNILDEIEKVNDTVYNGKTNFYPLQNGSRRINGHSVIEYVNFGSSVRRIHSGYFHNIYVDTSLTASSVSVTSEVSALGGFKTNPYSLSDVAINELYNGSLKWRIYEKNFESETVGMITRAYLRFNTGISSTNKIVDANCTVVLNSNGVKYLPGIDNFSVVAGYWHIDITCTDNVYSGSPANVIVYYY